MKYLSLCAILRDEGRYIEEWVKYHYFLGVEHFYLYENESKDNTLKVLNALAAMYPITLQSVKGAPVQLDVYRHCLSTYRKDSRWIGFLDGDEFIVPKKDLKTWLKAYETYAGVVAHWYLFGSNGEEFYTPEPVVSRFTKRQDDVNPHFKSFVNPMLTNEPFTPHRFTHSGYLVDEHGRQLKDDQLLQYNGTTDYIQINHYVTKSKAECYIRRQTARPDTGEKRNIDEFFKSHDRNDVEDLQAKAIWEKIICFMNQNKIS